MGAKREPGGGDKGIREEDQQKQEEAGEMAHWLRTLTALADDLGSILSTSYL